MEAWNLEWDGHGCAADWLAVLAAGIMARKPLCERLVTGIKAVDAFHPIGHGQCLGLMGKKGSGKSSLALHVMLNQKEPNAAAKTEAEKLRCIYVAVGQVSAS